jgi:hypothetical protein
MSLFTLGSARVVLVVALVYSFPDVFNVIMALISPYTNQPFIAPNVHFAADLEVLPVVRWLMLFSLFFQ